MKYAQSKMIQIASVTRLIVKCLRKQQASDEQLNVLIFQREKVEEKKSGTNVPTQRTVSHQSKRGNGQAGMKTGGRCLKIREEVGCFSR